MDPLTAGLQLANTIASIWLLTLQSMTNEQRATQITEILKDIQVWRNLLTKSAAA